MATIGQINANKSKTGSWTSNSGKVYTSNKAPKTSSGSSSGGSSAPAIVTPAPTITTPKATVTPIVQTSTLAQTNKDQTGAFLDWAKTNLTTQQNSVLNTALNSGAKSDAELQTSIANAQKQQQIDNETTKTKAFTTDTTAPAPYTGKTDQDFISYLAQNNIIKNDSATISKANDVVKALGNGNTAPITNTPPPYTGKTDAEFVKYLADNGIISQDKVATANDYLASLGGTPPVVAPEDPNAPLNETPQEKALRVKQEALDAQYTDMYNKFQEGMDKMLNGTYPLNTLQQAQLDASKQQYQALIDEQKKANAQYEGMVGQAGITSGRSRYAPEMEAGNILEAVSAGIAKVTDLNAKMTSSLTQMQAGFQTDNYNLMKESYSAFQSYEADRQKVLDNQQKLISDALKATQKTLITSSRDSAVANIIAQGLTDVGTILDLLNYYEDGTPTGANFTSDEVKNTLSNIYKEPKAAKVVPGTVTSGSLTYSPKSASEDQIALENSRGEDGYADPTTYQNLYKAWIQAGGMLKDFITKYPPEQYVNPANTWLPPFLKPKANAIVNPYATE